MPDEAEQFPATLLHERDWLIALITDPGRVDVTDAGMDMVRQVGEIVYEVPYGRFEVTIRRLP